MNIVEEVAIAISYKSQKQAYGTVLTKWEQYDEYYKKNLMEQAKESIEIMRKIPDVCYDDYKCDKVWRELNSKEVFNLWIDAALDK